MNVTADRTVAEIAFKLFGLFEDVSHYAEGFGGCEVYFAVACPNELRDTHNRI
jgi:hypothetical protein